MSFRLAAWAMRVNPATASLSSSFHLPAIPSAKWRPSRRLRLGHDVKWFIVSSSEESSLFHKWVWHHLHFLKSKRPVAVSNWRAPQPQIYYRGACRLDDDDASSALAKWCQNANGLICCLDGIPSSLKGKMDEEDPRKIWINGIKVAAQQASTTISGNQKWQFYRPRKTMRMRKRPMRGGVGGLLKSVMGANKRTHHAVVTFECHVDE